MTAMHYVKVLVAEATYHRKEALTYGADEALDVGRLVSVPLQGKQVTGVVVAVVNKPLFAVKKIIDAPQIPPLPKTTLGLLQWMRVYYPAPLGILTSLFLPQNLPKNVDRLPPEDPGEESSNEQPPLTKDQIKALKAIDSPGMHLLHGETGTGKTRVYIELAKRSLKNGRSAIVLTPEIGLTSQLVNDFRAVFKNRVFLMHSQLTDLKRRQIWLQSLRQTKPLILVGPRSALFVPVRSIDLIVVDESHETAYKQDRAPYYHASIVAAKLAGLHNATIVLGSATPLITDYTIARAKKRPIVRMTETATNNSNTGGNKIQIVDLRNRNELTKSPYVSDKLIESMRRSLERHEQILLFLNRRGTARVVFCEQCGWQATCPHCDLPLVYHGDTHRMQCHTCAYRAASPAACPQCQNTSIVFKSVGTKAVTEHVAKIFPEAKIQRFDTDNKRGERLEKHFEAVRRGEIDIIVGTQTIAKGLDLPKLGLVGIILADTSLSFPDFSAQERTYQLLSQVIGRVGRGHRTSKAIVQTYNPDSPVIKAVINKDWNDFLTQELSERRQFRFPPFRYLLKLTCRRASPAAAERAGEALAANLRKLPVSVEIEGPAPSFHEKLQNKYQWQIIVKARQRNDLLKIIEALPANWSYDIDPLNLL